MTVDNFNIKNLDDSSFVALARTISLVENEIDGYEEILINLPASSGIQVIGITGPPGAGKSTLTDALIEKFVADKKKVGVLCIDPSSPFNKGALLGDRIRMSGWYNDPNVFIRSLASRGSLGGLNPKIIEITDVMKAAGFDYIIIETVGVGQSEVEIAGLADTTVVVLMPESGDEIQTMKSGLMEVADIFVVNKADRPEADTFLKNLMMMLAPSFHNHALEIPVIKTVASRKEGVQELYDKIKLNTHANKDNDKRVWLLTEKAYQLITKRKMTGINKDEIFKKIRLRLKEAKDYNIYKLIPELLKDNV